MFTNYKDALAYMYTQLPMFTRIGAAAYKADLNNITALCDALGNPHRSFKSIHIAGTNGKGSTSNFIASVLMEAGYKVGLYTSPHLVDFRERIRIDGKMISKRTVTNFINKNQSLFQKIQPSFFEMTVALAFQSFASENVDIAIIEVGMGGRLDATNIISPLISVITNIGWDHKDFLGDSILKIGIEKAGIIKKNTPCIINEKQEELSAMYQHNCKEMNASLIFAEDCFSILEKKIQIGSLQLKVENKKTLRLFDLKSPLSGLYQCHNLKGVLAVVEILNTKYDFKISTKNVENGIQNVIENLQFYGRWQILSRKPLVILDVAHNPDGIKALRQTLDTFSYKKLHWIVGMVKDKDVDTVLRYMPEDACYYCITPPIPRGLDAMILSDKMKNRNFDAHYFSSPQRAYNQVLKNYHEGDLILIAGSCFIMEPFIKKKWY